MRLINADELKKELRIIERCATCKANGYKFCRNDCPVNKFCDLIDSAPTVDADAIHNEKEQAYYQGYEDSSKKYRKSPGKWIYPYYDNIIGKKRVGKSIRQCSICDKEFSNNIPWDANFCPNCGADMREGE